MNRRKLLALAAMTVTLGLAASTPARAEQRLKVGFTYVGPVGDAGWIDAHD